MVNVKLTYPGSYNDRKEVAGFFKAGVLLIEGGIDLSISNKRLYELFKSALQKFEEENKK